jgi:hypothetical protein
MKRFVVCLYGLLLSCLFCENPIVLGSSHDTHKSDPKGPNFGAVGEDPGCTGCHLNSDGGGMFLDGEDLATTTVCNDCHSPDGVFPGASGLDDPDIGAKVNWDNGVYEEDSTTLKFGKEQWCASCHDDAPAYSLPWDASEPIIVDNTDPDAGSSGYWKTSIWASGFYGTNYQYHAPGAGDYFRWTPTITEPGSYTVYVKYPQWQSPWNWATNATFTVYHDRGTTPVSVNQRENGGTWVSLGEYSFDGTDDYVQLSSHASSYVIADAVEWGSGASGTYAPNVIGDNDTYGFYVNGHKINCLSCHDASAEHIDGKHRTYDSQLNNYQVGYRLRSVDGEQPMNIPRPKTSKSPRAWASDFALCFDCHNLYEVVGEAWNDVSHTNFWNQNQPTNSHNKHLKMWRSNFDSDWDGTGDSEYTCTACHNVHGSLSPAMIRHGELISTYGTTDKVPALNFSYLVPPTEFATATWAFSGSADTYRVYARWTSDPVHRASNAKYTIYCDGGSALFTKNKQMDGGTWSQFGTGTYSFGPGNSVLLSNEDADGFIVADAIGWDKDGLFVNDWDRDGVLDPEIVVDNPAATYVPSASAWKASSWTPGYHGTNYQYRAPPKPVPDPNVPLPDSLGGIMNCAGSSVKRNGVCSSCHGAIGYYRLPNLGPKVIFPRAEPASVDNDGTAQVSLLAHVVDKDDDLIPSDPVIVNLLPIGGSEAQPMYDDGRSGDQVPNDGIFTYLTTVPESVDIGYKTLLVSATDQEGKTSEGRLKLNVTCSYPNNNGPWTTQIGYYGCWGACRVHPDPNAAGEYIIVWQEYRRPPAKTDSDIKCCRYNSQTHIFSQPAQHLFDATDENIHQWHPDWAYIEDQYCVAYYESSNKTDQLVLLDELAPPPFSTYSLEANGETPLVPPLNSQCVVSFLQADDTHWWLFHTVMRGGKYYIAYTIWTSGSGWDGSSTIISATENRAYITAAQAIILNGVIHVYYHKTGAACILHTQSSDAGETWSDPNYFPHPTYGDQFSDVVRCTRAAVRVRCDKIVMVYNADGKIRICTSENGTDFVNFRDVVSDYSAYLDYEWIDDEEILIVWSQNDDICTSVTSGNVFASVVNLEGYLACSL